MKAKLPLIVGGIAACIVAALPLESLTPEARRLAVILVVVVAFWIGEPIPLPVTALLGVALAVLAGVTSVEKALAAFGDPIVLLFMGTFMMARAMNVHGMDKRIAYAVLSHPWVKTAPRLLWAVGFAAALLAMGMSITACAAMLFPAVLAISRTMQRPRLTQALLFMLAYGAAAGAVTTPVGTPPNLIGISLIRKNLGISIGFLEWMWIGAPIALALLASRYALLLLLFRPERGSMADEQAEMKKQYRALGPWTAGQRNSLLAFGVAAALWLLPGIASMILGASHAVSVALDERLVPGLAALVAASLLFILPISRRTWKPTLTWTEAAQIDWGTILLFAGGISLGTMMLDTGLAEVLGHSLVGGFGAETIGAWLALSIGASTTMSELVSNTASVNMLVPVMLSVVPTAHALAVALGATLAASLGFMLPIATPAMAIIYGSGVIRMKDMIKIGILVDLTGMVILWLFLQGALPFIARGLH